MNSDYPQRPQWPSHLLPQQDYAAFYSRHDSARPSAPSSLALNLSSLSVTSPPCPSPQPALEPSTPVSPSVYPPQQYQFDPAYDDHPAYDNRRTPGPSRSSSATSSSSHLARKRSFSSTPVLEEENLLYDEARDAPMELASSQQYDDIDMRYSSSTAGTANGSPIDGSDGTSSADTDAAVMGAVSAVGGNMNVLGKPLATNNFVTKLYQMINDAKSAHYIAWTELGTSFVVSNVGEFSRSILGSHFKHNNFSSFVRQLNMYGFHKINRTPRAQRTSTDAQTWEFSHHKFLRGRPDLLDEIKRKALEPDPAMKHRVELPGEVAAQLGAMRDENRRVWEQLSLERKRTDRLVCTLRSLWEFAATNIGGLSPFPDLSDNPNIYVTSPGLQSSVNPASSAPTPGRFAPPPLSMNNVHMGNPTSLHSMHSPNSNSPTQPDFSAPQQQGQAPQASSTTPAPALSRQQSFQHVSYLRGDASPLPTSPGSSTMEIYEESDAPSQTRGSTKRQRISADDDLHPHPHAHSHATHTHMHGSAPPSAHTDIPPPPSSLSSPGQSLPRRPSRARSDSAPLGYGFGSMGMGWAGAGRPRSGSARGVGLGVPNMSMTNGNIGPRGVGVGMATGAGAQTGLGLGALGVQSTVGASTVGR